MGRILGFLFPAPIRRTWAGHGVAVSVAHDIAKRTGCRQRVVRRDGEDDAGPYSWVIEPTAESWSWC